MPACPGSAAPRSVSSSPTIRAIPQKGRAEAERLITQEKVCAIIGSYQSAVAVTVSQICERYQIPFRLGRQLVAEPAYPRPEILLPRRTA